MLESIKVNDFDMFLKHRFSENPREKKKINMPHVSPFPPILHNVRVDERKYKCRGFNGCTVLIIALKA